MKKIKDYIKRICATSLIFLVGCSSEFEETEEFVPEIIISPRVYSSFNVEENNNYDSEEQELPTVIEFDYDIYQQEQEYEIPIYISDEFLENNKTITENPKILKKHIH